MYDIDEKIADLQDKIGKMEKALDMAYTMLDELVDLRRTQAKSPVS